MKGISYLYYILIQPYYFYVSIYVLSFNLIFITIFLTIYPEISIIFLCLCIQLSINLSNRHFTLFPCIHVCMLYLSKDIYLYLFIHLTFEISINLPSIYMNISRYLSIYHLSISIYIEIFINLSYRHSSTYTQCNFLNPGINYSRRTRYEQGFYQSVRIAQPRNLPASWDIHFFDLLFDLL